MESERVLTALTLDPTIFIAEGKIKISIKIFREEERVFIQTLYPGRTGIWRCCYFCGERKPSEQGENQHQTHPRVKLVGGEGHRCTISAPQELPPILNIEFGRPPGWSQNTLQGLGSLMSHVVSILHAKNIYFPVFHSVLRYNTNEIKGSNCWRGTLKPYLDLLSQSYFRGVPFPFALL